MQRKKVTLLIKDNKAIPYGSLTLICRDMGWNYNNLKARPYPFTYKGYKISRETIIRS